MGRAPCCDKNGLKKGPWTPEEDQKLIDYIQKNGYGNWRILPKNAGLQRCGKSCRLRWTNYLRPDIKRGRFSFEEEETIIQLHSVLGNKWSAIAARLPGRTDNEIKNYWNTHIRKRLLRMGIDPVTHSPRLDLPDLSTIPTTTCLDANFQFDNFEQLTQNLAGFGPGQVNEWQQNDGSINNMSTMTEDYVPVTNCGYYGSGRFLVDPTPSSETSAFQSNNGSNNFSFQSVLSTPSSSPTPLHDSSSTYNNITEGEEDEREISNMLKFDQIPEILDVNDFI